MYGDDSSLINIFYALCDILGDNSHFQPFTLKSDAVLSNAEAVCAPEEREIKVTSLKMLFLVILFVGRFRTASPMMLECSN